ncbi:MAG: hypothetical protein O4861_01045 [Trichodesmium sp. St16_bin4-tuft]|nr:hypothetical protein [Trichodesmium sp. MAG_R01]MDE5068659.1 hypothetical protein [Trichodesmium sp. St4_bin8_1]MDE5073187.1 hypothetical protein [Trichodesmium sp. St5_bin8]MDE5092493.1 hypothetical protein [Trichodesmium sp. St18_bin3_1_1]MDE5096998.1 hypothetical protein [Trichodesmium sp. St16_bin4-tuft]MDE5105325.1 hypothetical protein [Trichodesmium sp. St19_bin2]
MELLKYGYNFRVPYPNSLVPKTVNTELKNKLMMMEANFGATKLTIKAAKEIA